LSGENLVSLYKFIDWWNMYLDYEKLLSSGTGILVKKMYSVAEHVVRL